MAARKGPLGGPKGSTEASSNIRVDTRSPRGGMEGAAAAQRGRAKQLETHIAMSKSVRHTLVLSVFSKRWCSAKVPRETRGVRKGRSADVRERFESLVAFRRLLFDEYDQLVLWRLKL